MRIEGVRPFCMRSHHAIVQDRIEAGTFMVAAAIQEGDVIIKDANF